MKFGQYLKALDMDAPAIWQGRFLDYRKLKKTLKRLGSCANASKHDANVACCRSKRDAFFDCLHKEVYRVNREFLVAARRVVRDSENKNCSVHWLLRCFSTTPVKGDESEAENLILRAEWCRRFSQINSVALRKILKKYDKLTKGHEGSDYLQRVWSGNLRSCGSFLHSPLLEELKSLQVMLQPRLPFEATTAVKILEPQNMVSIELTTPKGEPERVELPMLPSLKSSTIVTLHTDEEAEAETAPQEMCTDCCKAVDVKTTAQHSLSHSNLNLHHLKGASEEVNRAIDAIKAEIQEALYLRNFSLTSSGVGHEDEPEVADEHLCPICLEAMYQPIGLECGHAFCADCAFTSAGKGYALGSVRAILEHVCPDARCPECRTKGVYVLAVQLKKTEALIKQRYPKQWAERAADAKAKEARLRRILAIKREELYQSYRTSRIPL